MHHDTKAKALTRVHLGYLSMAITAALVKVVDWQPAAQVFGRMLTAAAIIVVILSIQKKTLRIHRKDLLPICTTGVLFMIHWATFFYGIVTAGVPTAVVVVATIPMFSALFEPILHKKIPDGIDLFLGVLVFFGAAILIEDFSLASASGLGVVLCLISAIAKSLRDVTSRTLVQKYGSMKVMMYQLSAGSIAIAPWFHPSALEWNMSNISGVLYMGFVGTFVAHTLVTSGFHTLKAVTVNLIGSIAPFYQIAFGILLISDMPTLRVAIGGMIIVGVAALETWRQGQKVENG